jgi:periplasmic copper chaperone A
MKPLLLLIALAVSSFSSVTMACETVTSGSIIADHAWTRATIGAGRPGALYVTITNDGTVDDALMSIETSVARMSMMHQTVVEDGIAKMPHAASIPLPAGETVFLEPGGLHGMLTGLDAPLKEGTTIDVTLRFEKAGALTLKADVLSLRAEGPECDGEH